MDFLAFHFTVSQAHQSFNCSLNPLKALWQWTRNIRRWRDWLIPPPTFYDVLFVYRISCSRND